MSEAEQGREIGLDQLLSLRVATEAVSTWLRKELEDRLETLRPLLAPRRYLGDHIKSSFREEVKDADKVFEALQAIYREASGEPLKLVSRLEDPIENISAQIEIHPWEYAHLASAGGEPRRVTVKAPNSWILTHACSIGFSQVRQVMTGAAVRSDADLKQFALSAILMKIIFDRLPGLGRMMEALRYRIDVVTCPETGKLPLLRLTSCVPSFRPADGAILNAVRLSGVPIFEELVDVEAIPSMEDALREKLAALTSGK